MTDKHELVAQPASVSGAASVIRAADKPQGQLQAQPATLRATITVTRAGTGNVETFDLVGTAGEASPIGEQL